MADMRNRPLVTFALFSFNQEQFIREAVEAALAQSYEPLEIIISDDCSTDASFEIISDIAATYSGPHNLRIYKNDKNLGVCAHVNSVFGKANGALFVGAAGDDVSLQDRVEKVAEFWQKTNASAVYNEATIIDGASNTVGEWKLPQSDSNVVIGDALRKIVFYGAGAAYDKSVFDKFGPLPLDVRNEDYNLAFRSALMNGLAYINEPLIRYRQHSQNLSFWVRIRNVGTLREAWAIKSEMHRNALHNQQHVLDYIRSNFGDRYRLYREYRSLVLSTLLRHKVYRKLGSADRSASITCSEEFKLVDYFRLFASVSAKLPEMLWRQIRGIRL